MIHQNSDSLLLEGAGSVGMVGGSFEGDQDYMKQMKDLHAYLDMMDISRERVIRMRYLGEKYDKTGLLRRSTEISFEFHVIPFQCSLSFKSSMPRPYASL